MKKTFCVATGLTVAVLGSHAIGVHADEPARPMRYEVHEIGFVDLNRPATSGGWLSTVPPDTPLKGVPEFRARRAAIDLFAMQGPGAAGGARAARNGANGNGNGRGNQPGGPAANRPPANPPANPPVPAPNMGGNGRGGGPAAQAPQPPPPWQGGGRQGGQPASPNPGGPGAQPAPNPGAGPNPGAPPRRGPGGRDARPQDPALFFYTDQPVKVSVRVGFNNGLPVAWWPKARPDGRDLVFKDVTVSPRLQAPKPESLDTARWPGLEPLKQFRAVGATPVKVGKAVEGALVYEGALPFAPKIVVKRGAKGSWTLRNGGEFTLTDVLFVPAGERAKCVLVGSLPPAVTVTVTPSADNLQELAGSTEMLLRGTGLFPKEVTALRKVLLSSEFVLDPGSRVLARVPQKKWDKLFPLTIEPKPRQLLRVGVLRLFDAEHYDATDVGRIPLAVTGGRRVSQGGSALGAGAAGR